jgi:hypothetical protein
LNLGLSHSSRAPRKTEKEVDAYGMHLEPKGIGQKVPLLALDLPAHIESGLIRSPTFSALLTLRLSMIAALGLAWRSAWSQHRT